VLMYVRVCACVSADNVSALVHLPYKSHIKYGGIQSIFETFATYKPLYSRMEAPLPSTSTVPYKGHLCNIEVYGVIFFLRFFFLSHYTIQRPTIQYGGILSIFETFATYKPLYSRMEATLPSTSTVPYKGHLYNMEVYRVFSKRLPRISPYTAVWSNSTINVNCTIQRSPIQYGGIQSTFETFATYKPLYSRMKDIKATIPYKGQLYNTKVCRVLFF
jgi:hypothetical protein